jgi:hypothetical protein
MSTNARDLAYRPLLSGISIANEVTGVPGTLGCIGLDDADQPWIVSCYHVLGRGRQSAGAPANDEPILQSTIALGGGAIARTRLEKMNALLDYAAALVLPGVGVSTSVFDLDKLERISTAVEGMKVTKSGAETGVTTGIVTDVGNGLITIENPLEAPDDYVLSDRGDSGAVWLDVQTGHAIGLHFSGVNSRRAFARPLGGVLKALGLHLLV